MNILDNLYDGNIRPNEKQITENSDCEKLLNVLNENYAELYSLLNEKELSILKRIEETESDLIALSEREAFKYGFTLGLKLTMETITHKSENFKPIA